MAATFLHEQTSEKRHISLPLYGRLDHCLNKSIEITSTFLTIIHMLNIHFCPNSVLQGIMGMTEKRLPTFGVYHLPMDHTFVYTNIPKYHRKHNYRQ